MRHRFNPDIPLRGDLGTVIYGRRGNVGVARVLEIHPEPAALALGREHELVLDALEQVALGRPSDPSVF